MVPPPDIFRIGTNKQLVWKSAATDLTTAQERIKILVASEPGDYIIFSQHPGEKTLIQEKRPDPNRDALHYS
jgi:hypothetical protein